MPMRLKSCETTFKWQLGPSNLPICEVKMFGGIPYALICPLCGCFHELKQPGGVIKPRCLLREYAGQKRIHGQAAPWQTIYDRWLKLHPEATDHTLIYVMTADQIRALDSTKSTKSEKVKAA